MSPKWYNSKVKSESGAVGSAPGWGSGGRGFESHLSDQSTIMPNKVQFVRVTTSNRLPDRFLTCQIKEPTEDQPKYGRVLALIEILNPWFPTSQIGQLIINTLVRNYYKAESTSDLENFETALLKVNEALASITQSGETDWIGNLNGIVAVLIDQDIHLSQSGKAEAYLIREAKLNHITYGLTLETEPHPLKTFSNITSGSLKVGDQIIFASAKFSEYLTPSELNSIVSHARSPYQAALQIAKILKRNRQKSVNLILIKIGASKEEAEPEVIYLDQPLESPTTLLKKYNQFYLIPFAKAFGIESLRLWADLRFFTKKYLWPKSRDALRYASYYSKVATHKITKRVAPKISKLWTVEELEPPFQETKEPEVTPPYKVRHYEAKENRFSKTWSLLGVKIQIFWRFVLRNRRSPSFYIILATLLILILILSINFSRGRRTESVQLQNVKQVLLEAKTKFEDGKLSLAYNEKDRALSLLSEAKTKADSIKDSPLVKDEVTGLLSQINQELDKITGTTRILAQDPKINFESSKEIFEKDKGIFTISPNNNTVFRASLVDGRVGKVSTLETSLGLYKDAVLFPQSKGILIYTFLKKLFIFHFADNTFSEVEVAGSLENADALATFGSNIYLLDGKEGQIYKHSQSEGKYLAGSPYAGSDVSLGGGVSLTIDGNVWVLHSDGKVTKLTKGRKVDFELSKIPQPDSTIEKPAKIYTDENINSIYILDSGKNRVLVFDKKGVYQRQYVFEGEGLGKGISDFDLNIKDKKLWALSENKVFETDLLE